MGLFTGLFKAMGTNGYAVRVAVKREAGRAFLQLTNIGVNTIIIRKIRVKGEAGEMVDVTEQAVFIKPEERKALSFGWEELCNGIYLSVKDSTVGSDVVLGRFLEDGREYTYTIKNQPFTYPKGYSEVDNNVVEQY